MYSEKFPSPTDGEISKNSFRELAVQTSHVISEKSICEKIGTECTDALKINENRKLVVYYREMKTTLRLACRTLPRADR